MILVLGGSGQLGRALGTRAGVVAVGRAEVDVTDPRAVTRWVCSRPWSGVVNAAAFTAVDAAERDRSGAFAVNADGAGHVAEACARVGLPLVHVSTDHVFDGTLGRPARPGDPVRPVNAYGESKAAGEAAVRAAHPGAVVARTSWVFGPGTGFPWRMVALARRGRALRVVADQWACPTPTGPLADALLALLRRRVRGRTLHVVGHEATTKHGLVTAALAAARVRVPVGAIPAAAWPAPASRPMDGRLDGSETEALLGGRIDWRDALVRATESS